jgi:L-rhamnose mutarotase
MTPASSGTNEIVGWRTTLRPGAEDDYMHAHSRVPDAVADALRAAGVVSWRIWRDGSALYHTIETTGGLAAMGEAMAALGPIDPDWDRLIARLVDDGPNSARLLPLVWGMDRQTQFS